MAKNGRMLDELQAAADRLLEQSQRMLEESENALEASERLRDDVCGRPRPNLAVIRGGAADA